MRRQTNLATLGIRRGAGLLGVDHASRDVGSRRTKIGTVSRSANPVRAYTARPAGDA